jgi:hypothetical protein
MLNKLCTWTAKSAPYLSCHRDNFSAKVPGPVAGWLHQVTQPPHIAGPLQAIYINPSNPNKMKKCVVLFIIFLSVISKGSSQDTIRYSGKIKDIILYESLELYHDNTFKWTSEYDLTFSRYGIYSISKDTLKLYFFDINPPKTMSITDSIKLIKTPSEMSRYIFYKNKLYWTNRRGKRTSWIKEPSLWTFWTGHRFKYCLIKIK